MVLGRSNGDPVLRPAALKARNMDLREYERSKFTMAEILRSASAYLPFVGDYVCLAIKRPILRRAKQQTADVRTSCTRALMPLRSRPVESRSRAIRAGAGKRLDRMMPYGPFHPW
jgi:hypothetical protein